MFIRHFLGLLGVHRIQISYLYSVVRRLEGQKCFESCLYVQKKFDELISGDKEKYPGTVQCFYLDLMRLESVRTFASTVLDLDVPIHVLVNNAGIMFGQR